MINDHRNLSRIQNKKLVLQQLFNNAETSRAEIARQLNLNKSIVDDYSISAYFWVVNEFEYLSIII